MSDINVYLEDFTDDAIYSAAKSRNLLSPLDLNQPDVDADRLHNLLYSIYHKRRTNENFDKELDTLIYYGLGRIL